MKKDSQIKGLQSQLNQARGKITAKKTELSNIQSEYQLLLKMEKSLAEKIEKLNNANVRKRHLVFSEHSLLQYMIRRKGLNLEDVEKELLTEKDYESIQFIKGNGSIINSAGVEIIIKNFKVVTII